MTTDRPRATPAEIRKYFGAPTVTLQELKALKTDARDYDDIAFGIADSSFTYPFRER